MGEDPEQLEREIEATRAKLGEDIDALEEKINPKKVAHRSVETAKGKVAEVKDKVAAKAAEAKDKVASKAGDAKDKVTPSSDGPGSDGPGVGEKAAGLAGTVKEKAAVRAGLDPQTADTRQVATTLAGDSWATLQDQTRRNPALVGAVAFVIGFVLGR